MASLRELKQRLSGVRTTGQLAGAMRTVATAKYSKINAVYAANAGYAEVCHGLLARFGGELVRPAAESRPGKELLVVCAGNRGLCGNYNSLLLGSFYEDYKSRADKPDIVAYGRRASEFCRERRIIPVRDFDFIELPDMESAREISGYLRERYLSGAASSVTFVYQHFENMLNQTPAAELFLPCSDAGSEEAPETLFLPDRATVYESVLIRCLDQRIYSIMLEAASGFAAATAMAMRSAYNNSCDSSAELESKINRMRQSAVTAGVIETSAELRDAEF